MVTFVPTDLPGEPSTYAVACLWPFQSGHDSHKAQPHGTIWESLCNCIRMSYFKRHDLLIIHTLCGLPLVDRARLGRTFSNSGLCSRQLGCDVVRIVKLNLQVAMDINCHVQHSSFLDILNPEPLTSF